jgi:hypothetical protein
MDKTHIVRVHHPSGKLYEAWCEFVGNHPDGTFFQSDTVFRHVANWSGAETVLLLLLDSSHRLHGSLLAVVTGSSGGLLARFNRTALVYGGPVLAPRRRLQEHMNLDALLKALISEVKHRSASIRFVNMRDWSDHQPVFNANGFSWSDANSLLLGTSHKNKVWSALDDECRRRIDSSKKAGAIIIEKITDKQLEEFYVLLQKLSSKNARKALPSMEFFKMLKEEWYGAGEKSRTVEKDDGEQGFTAFGTEVFEGRGFGVYGSDLLSTGMKAGIGAEEDGMPRFGGLNRGFFVLVQYQDRVIGGGVCPVVPGRLMKGWLLAGLDQQCGKYGVYPGILTIWAAIECAIKHRIPYISVLDRAVMFPGDLPGLQQLFGGDLLNYGRFVRNNIWRFR